MQIAAVPGLALFGFVTSITPGPNNLMLAAAGSRVGFRRTWPHMLGIIFGCAALFILAGVGLGAVVTSFPQVRTALRIAGCAYLLYLSYKLWNTSSLGKAKSDRPVTFGEAAAFQLVNPKGWMAIVPAVAAFSDPAANPLVEAAIIYVIFEAIMLPCIAVWAAMGAAARQFLEQPGRLVLFNRVMAALTAITALLFLL
jgi:threonine/homoserine/homoserine lactone efflux protein